MKILIVGGGGFVGSWLTHELISRRHKVVVIDPLIFYSTWDNRRTRVVKKFKKDVLLKGAKFRKGRFEDIGANLVKKEKPDILIHLAGIPLERVDDYDICLKQLSEDIGLTYQVIKAVKDNKVKKFVYMSSIAAYGDCDKVIDEKFPLIPKTPYGTMKASGEFLTSSELSNWNIVRSTNIYGFADLNGRGSNIILDRILRGEKIWINKGIIMDFINVKDIVSGIADVALKAPFKEVFHISGGAATGLEKYVDELKRYFTFDYEVKELNDRPKRGTMNNHKAKRVIGWSPKFNLKKGVADYIKYVKKYNVA